MSAAHFAWLSTGSTDRPMTLTFRLSNSGLILAMYPSSVVQTGVKSLGCEKSTAHESPIQSWKLIFPSVVSASKSGAVSPIVSAMRSSLLVQIRVEFRAIAQRTLSLRHFERLKVLLVAPDPGLGQRVGLDR